MKLVLTIVLLSFAYARSLVITPTNVTGNSALIQFDWDSEPEPSHATWKLEFWKNHDRVWHRKLDSKPSSLRLIELDEWTNYTIVLKSERGLYFRNVIYTTDVLLEYSSSFITVPRELIIKKWWTFHNMATVRASIQIHDPKKYKWSMEWKDMGAEHFDHKTNFQELPDRGCTHLDVDIPREDWWALARVRVKSKPGYPHTEEYYGPTQFIEI